jgi:hypothetical protein
MLITIPHLGISLPADDFAGTISTVAYSRRWELGEVPTSADDPWVMHHVNYLSVRYYLRHVGQEIPIPAVGGFAEEELVEKTSIAAIVPRPHPMWDAVWKNDVIEFASGVITLPGNGLSQPIAECAEFLTKLSAVDTQRLSGWLQALQAFHADKARYDQALIAFTRDEEAAAAQGTISTTTAPQELPPARELNYTRQLETLRKFIGQARIEGPEQPTYDYLKSLYKSQVDPDKIKSIVEELTLLGNIHLEPIMKVYETAV